MKNYIIISVALLLLSACQSMEDALTLKKKPSSDEFLVEKKSPLVLPPEYGKLPLPEGQREKLIDNNQESFESIINKNKKKVSKNQNQNNTTSIEKSILDKIK